MSRTGSTRSLNLFPGLKFELLDNPPPYRCPKGPSSCKPGRACDVCGMTVEGSVYHCKEEDLDVHPTCANLDKTIRVDDVMFELQEGKPKSKCIWCMKKKPEGSEDNIPGFRYVSECREYSFHVLCLMDMEARHRSTLTVDGCSCRNNANKVLAVPDTRLKRSSKFVKVVKMFLNIVLAVLFGNPAGIIVVVVEQMFNP